MEGNFMSLLTVRFVVACIIVGYFELTWRAICPQTSVPDY